MNNYHAVVDTGAKWQKHEIENNKWVDFTHLEMNGEKQNLFDPTPHPKNNHILSSGFLINSKLYISLSIQRMKLKVISECSDKGKESGIRPFSFLVFKKIYYRVAAPELCSSSTASSRK